MAKLVQQSTSSDPLFFFLVLTSDHISPATGLAPTVTISKNGAAFGAPAGAVTEIANGWYQVAGNATDTNTLGDVLLHASVATADNCDLVAAQVVAFNPRDSVRLGLTALPNAAANGVGGLSVLDANSLVDVDVKRWLATAVTAAAAGIPDVNAKNINNVSTSSVTTINANQGTTQPVNFTGTGASALVQSDVQDIGGAALATHAAGMMPADVRDIAGAAVATGTAQLGVNVVQYNAQTAQTDANNLPKVDVEDIAGNATAAGNVSKANQAIMRGTCSGGTTATAVCSSITSPASLMAAGQLIGRTILFDSNTATASLQGQASNITNSTTGATPTITFTAMTTAPANTDTFSVV